MRPAGNEYGPYWETYISLVSEIDVLPILEQQAAELRGIASRVSSDRETFRYAAGKWSVRQVVGHLSDTDRVFGFRAFCFSRGEQQPLPGFDQDDYMKLATFDDRPLARLVDEFASVRDSNLAVLRTLSEADLNRIGTASGHRVSVRALMYMMAGHVRHHLALFIERYGL